MKNTLKLILCFFVLMVVYSHQSYGNECGDAQNKLNEYQPKFNEYMEKIRPIVRDVTNQDTLVKVNAFISTFKESVSKILPLLSAIANQNSANADTINIVTQTWDKANTFLGDLQIFMSTNTPNTKSLPTLLQDAKNLVGGIKTAYEGLKNVDSISNSKEAQDFLSYSQQGLDMINGYLDQASNVAGQVDNIMNSIDSPLNKYEQYIPAVQTLAIYSLDPQTMAKLNNLESLKSVISQYKADGPKVKALLHCTGPNGTCSNLPEAIEVLQRVTYNQGNVNNAFHAMIDALDLCKNPAQAIIDVIVAPVKPIYNCVTNWFGGRSCY